MKKILALVMLSAMLTAIAPNIALAHPPKNLSASWNASTETLTVTAAHNVNDPAKHYVLSMTILEGDKQLLLKQYSRQGSKDGFSDSAVLKGLKKGAKLRIQLTCNIMGSNEISYIIQ